MGEFYRQEEGGERKLLANEKKVLFQAQLSVISLGSKGKVYVQITSSFFDWGLEVVVKRAQVTDHLIGADWKIPNWLIKNTFLGKAEATISLGIKSKFWFHGLEHQSLRFSSLTLTYTIDRF